MLNDIKNIIKTYCTLEKNFRVRTSANYSEVITDCGSKIVSNTNQKFKKGLFLFSMVKRDIERYILEYGYITAFDELPVNCINEYYDKDRGYVGLDINNAYWSVAHLKGYISENTFRKGLELDKSVRLSALSSLGKSRAYQVYVQGKISHTELVKGSGEIENFYMDIRYSTYGVMREIADVLGEDFYSWKTDCINFFDTKENRSVVKTMITDYGLECKVEKKVNKKRGKAVASTPLIIA